MCWTCGKCYSITKRLPGSLLSKSSHHLTTVKIFRDAIAPRRQRARAARRLCVGSEGPLTRSKWNINDHLQVPRLHREEVQRPIFMEPGAKKNKCAKKVRKKIFYRKKKRAKKKKKKTKTGKKKGEKKKKEKQEKKRRKKERKNKRE